jgi:hypothetical protein
MEYSIVHAGDFTWAASILRLQKLGELSDETGTPVCNNMERVRDNCCS